MLPLLTEEQKREYADAHYQYCFRLAERESVISVVASSLAEHDMTMLQLLCKETKNNNGQLELVRMMMYVFVLLHACPKRLALATFVSQ